MPATSKRTVKPSAPSKRSGGRRAPTTEGAINIRVRADERALIDQAALLSGKSRSEFMLEAARRAAADAILDRTLFRLEPAAFARFVAMLDAPPQPNERLRRLITRKAPWE